jgi:pseudouridine synthase
VNGRRVTTLGARARPGDRVLVDGKALPRHATPVYLALNKPIGVVSTLRDPEGRATARDYLPRTLPRVFPVGRLDVQSSGLVLLTNDGALAARLMHPRYHVPRVYRVKVRGTPDERALERLRRGVRLDDGPSPPAEVEVEERLPTKTWLRLTVHEGRKHLVRRLCDAVGHGAEKLQRVAIGSLQLGKLRPGACRFLTPGEVNALRAGAVSAKLPPSGALRRRSTRRRSPARAER